jgi:hypothetical protein
VMESEVASVRLRTAGVMTTLMRTVETVDRENPRQVPREQRGARSWLGPDQRITSGPAATAAAFKGRIHGCARTFR